MIVVHVTDDGDPPLSAAQWFTAVVRDVVSDVTLSVGSTNLLAGEDGVVPLLLASAWGSRTSVSFWKPTTRTSRISCSNRTRRKLALFRSWTPAPTTIG